MGDYNPHQPTILGEEWPGIRDENTQFSPAVDVVELGHTFRTESAYTLQDGRFYVREMPANTSTETYVFSLYETTEEAESGPIRRVVIPVESVWVTGATVSSGTAESAIFTPEMSNYILLDTDPANSLITTGFNTAPYTVLSGKRIVGVNVLYAAHRFFNTEDRGNGPYTYFGDAVYPFNANNLIYDDGDSIVEGGSLAGDEVLTTKLGDVCMLWQTPITNEVLPWNFSDLRRFDGSTANRLYVTIATGQNYSAPAGGIVYVWYMALEVLFCEETREIVGGFRNYSTELNYGANLVRLRSIGRTVNPSLAAGNWTATLAAADQGGLEGSFTGYPDLNALRELYALPTHEGVKVNITQTEGEVFTRESVNALTQLSVHASGGAPLTEVHAYGRIAPGPVYGAYTVTQDVYDDLVTAGTNYYQLRFYARRFGNTTKSLDVAISGTGAGSFAATVQVADFDELSEIVDGWKEVTVSSVAAATLGQLAAPILTWSATGETAGNRWEVLGVRAPAVSGIPGDLLNLVPAVSQLTAATYQPPVGTTINMSWQSPTASGVAGVEDTASDVVFYFSTEPPTLTNLTVTAAAQAVSGIGLDCAGGTPCCVPTSIDYNLITWSIPASGGAAIDTFTRTTSGWGTGDSGQTYTDSGGTVPGDYSVNGSEGKHTLTTANVARTSKFGSGITDSHQRTKVKASQIAAGAAYRGGLMGHYVDANNNDGAYLRFATTQSADLVISCLVAGVATDKVTLSVGAYTPNEYWWLDVDWQGATIRAKAWPVGTDEPTHYQAIAAANSIVGGVGFRSTTAAGNTNTNPIVSYDDYSLSPSTWTFGAYELQRFDPATDWQTIMSASSPAVSGFSDYEARVGQPSVYRIRATNLYDFAGTWSAAATGTVPSPGVSVSCDTGDTGSGTLIFTSNSEQSGSANLAYVMQFDRTVEEAFAFPEAGTSKLRRRYQKDYFTAFRPTERGGEQFSRIILVQGAAGAIPNMANIRSLRDLAWDDLPYVCVRDELGNRWFSNVLVPDVNIAQRAAYYARVDIAEVTGTSCEVDPS